MFIAVSILFCTLVLTFVIRPFEEKWDNNTDMFYTFLTISLASVCSVYVRENEDTDLKRLCQKVFIFGFLGMMGIILIELIGKALYGLYKHY